MALSKITTASLADDSVTGAKIENNPTIAGNLTVSGGFVPSESTSNRNMIINGAMDVIQRGQQVTIANGYTLDRWSLQNNTAGRATVGRDAEVPTGQGFLNSLKLDVTTADTSLAAGDIGWIAYRFEGQDLQQIRKGTSSAKKVTLQFWVRSPKTGTHIVQLYDADNNRHNCKSYTISSADTWQKVVLTFEADTTGAFDDDNDYSLQIYFALIAGSTYTSGTLASSAWASFSPANGFVGQVNVFDNTSNNFYITGVQLELGEVATPFEYERYNETLERCRRYYWKHSPSRVVSGSNYPRFMHGFNYSTSAFEAMVQYPVQEMRTNPALSYSAVGDFLYESWSEAEACNALNIGAYSDEVNCYVQGTGATANKTQGEGMSLTRYNNANAYLAFDAEL